MDFPSVVGTGAGSAGPYRVAAPAIATENTQHVGVHVPPSSQTASRIGRPKRPKCALAFTRERVAAEPERYLSVDRTQDHRLAQAAGFLLRLVAPQRRTSFVRTTNIQ
jgi:hypothetical protein